MSTGRAAESGEAADHSQDAHKQYRHTPTPHNPPPRSFLPPLDRRLRVPGGKPPGTLPQRAPVRSAGVRRPSAPRRSPVRRGGSGVRAGRSRRPAVCCPEEAAAVASASERRRAISRPGVSAPAPDWTFSASSRRRCWPPRTGRRSWPERVVGSITHTAATRWRSYAVSRRWGWGSMPSGLAGSTQTCTAGCSPPPNSTCWTVWRPAARDELATAIFGAKEAFYKAQHPTTRSWVGFQDVDGPARGDPLGVRPRRPTWPRWCTGAGPSRSAGWCATGSRSRRCRFGRGVTLSDQSHRGRFTMARSPPTLAPRWRPLPPVTGRWSMPPSAALAAIGADGVSGLSGPG